MASLGYNTERISGSNRVDTAIKLAERAKGRSSSVAVLAPEANPQQQIAEYLWKRAFDTTNTYVVINGEHALTEQVEQTFVKGL